VHVHDELRIAVDVSGIVGARPRGGAADGAQEDLALRRGQLAGVLDDGVEQPVVELRELCDFQ